MQVKGRHPTQKRKYAATIGEWSWHIWGPGEVQRIQGQGGISFRMMQSVGEGEIPPTLHPSWVLMAWLILMIKVTWYRLTREKENLIHTQGGLIEMGPKKCPEM